MRAVSHALLATVPAPNDLIVEVGCGSGIFAQELAAHYPDQEVLGVELHAHGLDIGRRSLGARPNLSLLQADLQHLPLPDGCCRLAIALDVLDQQSVDPTQGLSEVRRILRPGAWLLVRVSAYDWLFGPHDLAFGTARRYTARRLHQDLRNAGLEPYRVTYANVLLLPAALVSRALEGLGILPVAGELFPPAWLNHWLKQVLVLEARWLDRSSSSPVLGCSLGRDLPAGLSLFALARRL